MNGTTLAPIPLFTVNHPTIILTGTIPAQSLGNHTMIFVILWSDYGENLMTSNFATRIYVSKETSQPTSMPSQVVQTSGPTPTVPEISWLVVLALLLTLFSVAVVLRHRKKVVKKV